MEQDIIDPGSMGYMHGFQGEQYENPFQMQSDDYSEYKNGFDAGRNYLMRTLNRRVISNLLGV